jgi:hypothetical protein
MFSLGDFAARFSGLFRLPGRLAGRNRSGHLLQIRVGSPCLEAVANSRERFS